MKNTVVCLFISLFLFSCNQKKEGNEVKKSVQEKKQEPTKPKETEIWKPIPPTVTPGTNNSAPSDAIVLFDGNNFDEWITAKDSTHVKWVLNKDGSATVKHGTIQSKRNFASMQLHLEWKSPEEIKGDGQNRGNSGLFFQKKYEVQILDNNNNATYSNGQVGAIYKQSIPLAKASVVTGKWNTYDIIYHAPEFDQNGGKTKSGTITVLHNGILVQDHYEIKGSTEYIGYPKNQAHGKAPLLLQDHNCAVSYRNIWVRELN